MSLTGQLKDPMSDVSRFFAENLKSQRGFDQIVNVKNDLLARHDPFVNEGADPMEVGAAFGYALRWWISPSHMTQTVAARGAVRLSEEILFEAMLEFGKKIPNMIPIFSVMMARFDKAGRERKPDEFFQRYASRYKKLLLSASGFPIVPNVIVPYMFDDDVQLRANVFDVASLYNEIPSAWGDRQLILGASQVVFSPTFALSEDVGGADGWMILDGVLWDCRTTRKRRPFDKFNLLQQLGYVLLDAEDEYKIHSIGWYYARQRVQIVIELGKLVGDLPGLRRKFEQFLEDADYDDDFDDPHYDDFNYYNGYGG